VLEPEATSVEPGQPALPFKLKFKIHYALSWGIVCIIHLYHSNQTTLNTLLFFGGFFFVFQNKFPNSFIITCN
jgi:hypothetical protein